MRKKAQKRNETKQNEKTQDNTLDGDISFFIVMNIVLIDHLRVYTTRSLLCILCVCVSFSCIKFDVYLILQKLYEKLNIAIAQEHRAPHRG